MIKKVTIFLIGISVFNGLSNLAFAKNEVTFDQATGVVHIPTVIVGSEKYDVDMQQIEGLDFKVTKAIPMPINYRQEMRDFVVDLSVYSKIINSGFIVIPQNGQELMTDSGTADGIPQISYLQAINATGREDMFFGYNTDDEETPAAEKKHLLDLSILAERYNVELLATDYCSTPAKVDVSYQINRDNGFISFAANERNLNSIPTYPIKPFNENKNNITSISDAKNFLYLINSENYAHKQDFLSAVSATNYDVIIMDLFHNGVIYTLDEINSLKTKQNGGKRLVVAYLSIGEAESYRYYWQENWLLDKPEWLKGENPDWAGNYKVQYWNSDWQALIFGNNDSYLKKIIDAGFDGAYLDIIDAFEYFESQ